MPTEIARLSAFRFATVLQGIMQLNVSAASPQTHNANTRSSVFRLAILASHPIQYQAPLFRALAQHRQIDLTVFFCSHFGLTEYRDEGFGRVVQWDTPLLDGYRSQLLKNISPRPRVSHFWGVVNPSVISHLSKRQYDAVWVHGWAHCTNWIVMLIAFAKRIPVLVRGETNLLSRAPFWKKPIKRAVLSALLKSVSGVLAIGKHNAEFYAAFGVPEHKLCLVPYTVDNEFFLARADELVPKKTELRRQFGVPEALPVVLFVGKLKDAKCPHDLLEAYARTASEIDSSLIFVGDGALRERLEAYKQKLRLKHVYFTGFRNQSELPNFYAMADVFVLPSQFEPWGLVVNEAMCFGLPVIVSNRVGAIDDIVQDGINGFIYPAKKVDALAKHLRILLGDREMRHRMGESSKVIIRNWSSEAGVRNFVAWVQNFYK